MESNENEMLEFKIIIDYSSIIEEAIEIYNEVYHTDFVVVEYIDDEVRFAKVRARKAKLSDVFDLGVTYARFLDKNRV
jgi:hypothetical protein